MLYCITRKLICKDWLLFFSVCFTKFILFLPQKNAEKLISFPYCAISMDMYMFRGPKVIHALKMVKINMYLLKKLSYLLTNVLKSVTITSFPPLKLLFNKQFLYCKIFLSLCRSETKFDSGSGMFILIMLF